MIFVGSSVGFRVITVGVFDGGGSVGFGVFVGLSVGSSVNLEGCLDAGN